MGVVLGRRLGQRFLRKLEDQHPRGYKSLQVLAVEDGELMGVDMTFHIDWIAQDIL